MSDSEYDEDPPPTREALGVIKDLRRTEFVEKVARTKAILEEQEAMLAEFASDPQGEASDSTPGVSGINKKKGKKTTPLNTGFKIGGGISPLVGASSLGATPDPKPKSEPLVPEFMSRVLSAFSHYREDQEEALNPSPNQGQRKRPRVELPQDPDCDRFNYYLDLLDLIVHTVCDTKCKVNKEVKAIVTGAAEKIRLRLVADAIETGVLRGKVSTMETVVGKMIDAQQGIEEKVDALIKRPVTIASGLQPEARKSYAGITAGGKPDSSKIVVQGVQRELPPLQPTVLFYPSAPEGKSSEDTRKALQKVLDPKKDGFQPVRTRKIKGAGVLLQTSCAGGLANLQKVAKRIEAVGFKMVQPTGRLPRIVLYDVPRGEPAADAALFEEIFLNNIIEKTNLTKEDHLRTMRRVSLFGRRDSGFMNMIVTCHPDARKALIDSGHCYLGWNACRVRDFIGATRCFKCHLYGHVAKNCTAEVKTCRHCSEQGHDLEDCPKKALAAVCATCKRFNRPANHPTGDRNCPAHLAAVEAQVRMTDYGRR